jgi:uncharacterized membrane protein SpoIIM required for sporulation
VTRDELVKARKKRWDRLQELLYEAERGQGASRLGPAGISELAEIYRALAGDLMLVRRDKLGADLERHLDNLASRAHNALYAGTAVGSRFKIHTLFLDFAPALRRNLRFFSLAFVLFFGPGSIAGTAAYLDEAYALAVLSPEQLKGMEQMHGESHEGKGRDSDTNTAMTGFYVQHNVSIAFTCFATGILFGLGPIFYLLFNGIAIGVVVGHLARTGFGPNIFSFISSHGPWELIAIVICGGAGLQMGYALVSTRGRTRLGNLQAHGLELLRQVAGAAAFLTIAAMIEAWYSPSGLPNAVKYATGLAGWLSVFAIIAFAGRDRPVPPDVRELSPGARAGGGTA